MVIEENQYRICKRSRYSNGKLGLRENHQDEDDGEAIKGEVNDISSTINSMRQWNHPSSRIFRVSRALGGKDRHSKVYTSKGLRDRRVRLSVSTAIQFYDLQDRLVYDQPSKAIEWLIKSAESAISELPSLETAYPKSMNMQINIKKTMLTDSGNNLQQNSSNSETSKGSELSLSRSEIRVKARERARERVKDKEKDQTTNDPGLNSWGSFSELLTACQVSSSTADYFCTQSRITQDRIPSGFSSQTHFGNNSPIGLVPFVGNGTDHSLGMQQFSFLHDNISPVVTTEGDYNLNFSKSSTLAGFCGETLQSNSPFHHNLQNHHQVQAHKNSSALDARCMPFFFGVAANAAAAMSSTDQNQYSSGFYGHLQLFDGYKDLELKRKGKN